VTRFTKQRAVFTIAHPGGSGWRRTAGAFGDDGTERWRPLDSNDGPRNFWLSCTFSGRGREKPRDLPLKVQESLIVLDPAIGQTPSLAAEAVTIGPPIFSQDAGLGSGIWGVKLDDINGDDVPEIWCGDALGHIYCFRRKNTSLTYELFYRSEDLGAYTGLYNNLFPVKNGAGKTIRLVVVSAGYVMAFDVKHSFIPQVP
jgi:hypothetical protein